jgi:hypothetical protein
MGKHLLRGGPPLDDSYKLLPELGAEGEEEGPQEEQLPPGLWPEAACRCSGGTLSAPAAQ